MGKKRSPVDRLYDMVRKKKHAKNARIESLWSPYRDGITFSFIQQFLACRERTRKKYVEGWTSKHFKVPLEFGSIFHVMMEIYFSQKSNMTKAVNAAKKYVAKKEKKLNSQAKNDLYILREMVIVTFKEYIKYWNAEPSFSGKKKQYTDTDIRWLSFEEKFKFSYKLPNGKVIYITGMMDGKFVDPLNTKKIRLLENKTKASISDVDIEAILRKDAQTGLYMFALWKTTRSVPSGVLYNVIRRCGLKPGTASPEHYIDRVGEDIRKRPDHYYKRWNVDITKNDLELFMDRTMNPILMQIVDWWESIKDKPFDPWTTGSKKNELHFERPFGLYAGNVDLASTLEEIILDEDYSNFYQRDVCFPELE